MNIQSRFKNFSEEYPHHSTFINFSRAIEGQEYSKEQLQRSFNNLVREEDYAPEDKKAIIEYLVILTNTK